MAAKKYQEFIPHATLQDSVKRFWILEKEYGAEDGIEEVTPDACFELILNCGNPYSVISGSSKQELPSVCLVGLLTKPLRLKAEGLVKIVAVRFFAWGALAFLKNLAGRTDVTQVDLDPAWQQVVQRAGALVQGDNYQKAVEEVENFLVGLRLNILFDPKQVR